MENVSDKEEALTYKSEIEKDIESEATTFEHVKDIESEATTFEHVKKSIEDPVVVKGTEREENVKEEENLKVKVKKVKKRKRNIKLGGTNNELAQSIEDPMVIEGKEREEIAKQDVKNEEILKENLKSKVKKSKKKKKITLGSTDNEVVDVVKKPSSSEKMARKMVDGSGMIFMCNSKTKMDCYHYKVLGLPVGKKDIVSKIYKGMRLFLFDFDLKLMYGIYKAAGPGGNNIEPKAFKSAYPSQVRFTILEDCLPLAEEKFKVVIKDNYYTRNKFNCQLTPEQVKKLCKLFKATSKGPKSKSLGTSTRADTHRVVKYPKSERHGRHGISGRLTFVDHSRNRFQERDEERRQPYQEDHRVIYERDSFPSLPGASLPQHLVHAPLVHLPQYLPPPLVSAAPLPPAYTYDRPLTVDLYRPDRPLLEHREVRPLDHGRRVLDEIEHGDPYILHREPPLYHDRVYSSGVPVEYRRLPSPEAHPQLYYKY